MERMNQFNPQNAGSGSGSGSGSRSSSSSTLNSTRFQNSNSLSASQSSSSNSVWNLHPGFNSSANGTGAAATTSNSSINPNFNRVGFNQAPPTGPRFASSYSNRGSYPSHYRNLGWNRGHEGGGGSINKGKGKASNEQAFNSSTAPPQRPLPAASNIRSQAKIAVKRTEDLQPNELKTDFVYRNFIASNRPPTVKNSKEIPNLKLSAPSKSMPSSSTPASFNAPSSSSNSVRLPPAPSGPRSNQPHPTRPQHPSNQNQNSFSKPSWSRPPSSKFGSGKGTSADPLHLDGPEKTTGNWSYHGKEKGKDKWDEEVNPKGKTHGKGKGKGKAKDNIRENSVLECNPPGEHLSKKAARRRRRELRELAEKQSLVGSRGKGDGTSPNETPLPPNAQRYPSPLSISSSAPQTPSEVNRPEDSFLSPPQEPELTTLQLSHRLATAVEENSKEADSRSTEFGDLDLPQNAVIHSGNTASSHPISSQSKESGVERGLKRKASSPLPTSNVDSSPPPPYPSTNSSAPAAAAVAATPAVVTTSEPERDVKRVKPSFEASFKSGSALGAGVAVKEKVVELPQHTPHDDEAPPSHATKVGNHFEFNNQNLGEDSAEIGSMLEAENGVSENPVQHRSSPRPSQSSDASSSLRNSEQDVSSQHVPTRTKTVPTAEPVRRPAPRAGTAASSSAANQEVGSPSFSDPPNRTQVSADPPTSKSQTQKQAQASNSSSTLPSHPPSGGSPAVSKVKEEPIDVDKIQAKEVIILESDSDDDLPLAVSRPRSKNSFESPNSDCNGLELLPSMGAFGFNSSAAAASSTYVKQAKDSNSSVKPVKTSKPKMQILGLGESQLSAQLDPSHTPRYLIPISSRGYEDKSRRDFDSLLVLSRFGHASASRSDASFFGQPTPIFSSRSLSSKVKDVQRVSSRAVAVASSCQQAVHGEQPPQLTLLFARDPPSRDADADLDGSRRRWYAQDELEVAPIRHLESKPHTFGASCLTLFPGSEVGADGMGGGGDLDLVTGGSDGVVFRWTFNSKSTTQTQPQDRTSRIHALHVSTSSSKATGVRALTDLRRCNSLVSAGTDGKILIYDVDKQMEKGRWKTDDNLKCLKKCPSPHLFMSAQSRVNYDQFKCFDIRQGNKVSKPALAFGWQSSSLKAPSNLSRGSFNPTQKSLYSHPSSDGIVRLWDLRMPKEDPLEIVVSLEREIYDTSWSSDGKNMISLCSDGIRKTEVIMGELQASV